MAEVNVPERFNAATYFVDRNVDEGRGNKTAILYGDQEITYQNVLDNVNRTGNALRSLGVEIENRVMLLLLDSPQMVYSFFGAIKIGAVPIPTNTLLAPRDYHHLLQDSRARVLIISEELLAAVEPVLEGLNYLRHVIVVGEAAGYQSFARLIDDQPLDLVPADTSRDDAAFWLYTSGTTGMSRAAVHLQHDMVVASELYFGQVLGMCEGDRAFSVAKLFFAYGLGNALFGPFSAGGASILFPGRPLPQAVFEIVNRYRPTLFFAVPTAYASMLQAVDSGASVDMSSVRLAVSAGESLPPSIYERWQRLFGVQILDGIGSTEILHIFISNRPGEVRPGSSGTVVPGYEAKLVDDDGWPVTRGEIGNLLVKGDSTCALYWNKHEQSRRTIQGEWIRTGDKYTQDEDGYFWHAGRTDDMLKVGGRWVSPSEVEGAIIAHPAVLECAVVGAKDHEALIKPKAFVVLKDGSHTNEGMALEIQAFVKEHIAPYKYPRWVEFVDELPKTATGKIQRFKLRQS